jgi:hypothetical protein
VRYGLADKLADEQDGECGEHASVIARRCIGCNGADAIASAGLQIDEFLLARPCKSRED